MIAGAITRRVCRRLRNRALHTITWLYAINCVIADRRRIKIMPSLFRFLVFAGLVGGLVYVGVFALANFVKLQPREITVTVPADKFVKQPK